MDLEVQLGKKNFNSMKVKETTHIMPDGTTMPGATHSTGYTNIFKEKNYWIGVVVGMASLYAYQKYFKK